MDIPSNYQDKHAPFPHILAPPLAVTYLCHAMNIIEKGRVTLDLVEYKVFHHILTDYTLSYSMVF